MSFVLLGILNAQAAGAIAAGAMEYIDRGEAGASTSSITFTSGGAWESYQHLLVTFDVRSARASSFNFQDNFEFYINGDSSGGNSNYRRHDFYSQGAQLGGPSNSLTADAAIVARVSANEPTTTDSFTPGYLLLTDINSTDKVKTWTSFNHSLVESPGSNVDRLSVYTGSWHKSPNEAITSLEFYNSSANFIQYSELTLYGLGSTVEV